MKRTLAVLLVLCGTCALEPAAQTPDPVATFSILGYDPATGEVGGAVQSRVFSVGNGVLWAEAGVGIVGLDDLLFELTPRDAGLAASCSGDGDIMGFMDSVAASAAENGIVVIDVQTSELLDGSDADPEHLRWYRKVRFGAT